MRRSCCDDTRSCLRKNTLATITLNMANANKGAKVKVRSIAGLTKLMKMMKITNAINMMALVSKVSGQQFHCEINPTHASLDSVTVFKKAVDLDWVLVRVKVYLCFRKQF